MIVILKKNLKIFVKKNGRLETFESEYVIAAAARINYIRNKIKIYRKKREKNEQSLLILVLSLNDKTVLEK